MLIHQFYSSCRLPSPTRWSALALVIAFVLCLLPLLVWPDTDDEETVELVFHGERGASLFVLDFRQRFQSDDGLCVGDGDRIWTPRTGVLKLGVGGKQTQVCAISPDGSRVVGWTSTEKSPSSSNAPEIPTFAFEWTSEHGIRKLFNPQAGESRASYISNGGEVITGQCRAQYGSWQSCVWRNGGMNLEVFEPHPDFSEVHDLKVTADGSTLFGILRETRPWKEKTTQQFLWTKNSGYILLGEFSLEGISADGSIATGRVSNEPAIWLRNPDDSLDQGKLITLSSWLGNSATMEDELSCVSSDGSTIVGSVRSVNSQGSWQYNAIVWTRDGCHDGNIHFLAGAAEYDWSWANRVSHDGRRILGGVGSPRGTAGLNFASVIWEWNDEAQKYVCCFVEEILKKAGIELESLRSLGFEVVNTEYNLSVRGNSLRFKLNTLQRDRPDAIVLLPNPLLPNPPEQSAASIRFDLE